jgi:nucleotide-binding universal stress UspA family protein
MKPGNILINLNDSHNLGVFLETSCAYALRNDAHLIGAFVIPAMQIYPVYEGIALAEIIDDQHQKYKERAGKVREKFEQALKKNLVSGEWRELDSSHPYVADKFIEQARSADLVMISQVVPDVECGVEQEFAERVIMESGRPVLIIPRNKPFSAIGERVLIGWNRTQESARASFDAMMLLSEKSEVNLVWVNPQKESQLAGKFPGVELAKTFAHHNINVTTEALPTMDTNVGDALLTRAIDLNSDLLVMGAYGHSRMREFIFGGATRHVLDNMTLPVLMSH